MLEIGILSPEFRAFTFMLLAALTVFAFLPMLFAIPAFGLSAYFSYKGFAEDIERITSTEPFDDWNTSLAKESVIAGLVALALSTLASAKAVVGPLEQDFIILLRRLITWFF